MECIQCKSSNPDGSKYCSNCGFRLDASLNLVRDYLDVNLPREVQDSVKKLVKDQNVVELEISEAVATRLSKWAKLLGFFVGISITLLVVALGIVGIKSASDMRDMVKNAEKDISDKYQNEIQKVDQELEEKFRKATEKQADTVRKEGDKLIAEYKDYKTQLDEARQRLTERVSELEKKVEKFEIKSSPSVTEEMRRQLTAELDSYQQYLIGLGYRPKADKTVAVEVRSDTLPGAVAYYDDSKGAIVVNSKYVKDLNLAEMVLREYGHRVFYSFEKINFATTDENAWSIVAIESGLVTYLACSFHDTPVFSKPGSVVSPWDLRKKRAFGTLKPDLGLALRDGTEIWGGVFWEIRSLLGKDLADQRLFSVWSEWEPAKGVNQTPVFAKKLLESIEKRDGKEQAARVKKIFEDRGLTL
jgi:hypothetical protein